MMVFVKLSNNLQKAENTHVSENLVFNWNFIRFEISSLIHFLNLIWIFEFPNQQECITNVFVSRSTISVYHWMCYLSNWVYILHDVFLQNLSSINKVVENTESENTISLLSRHHRVKLSTISHVLSNNSSSSFSKPKSK